MQKKEFYEQVGVILNITIEYNEPKPYLRRWGQRTSGNGRIKDFGLIRYYSCNMIHVTTKNINKIYKNVEEVFEELKNMVL